MNATPIKPRYKLTVRGDLLPVPTALELSMLEEVQQHMSVEEQAFRIWSKLDRGWYAAFRVGVSIMQRMGCVPGFTSEPDLAQRLLRAVWDTAEAHSKGLR